MRIPIRFKILVTTLAVMTVVLGVITFTMARLFHSDKEAYIRDLASIVAQHTGEEARGLLAGYSQRLQVFSRLVYEGSLTKKDKSALVKQLFQDFQEFVSITIYENDIEQITLYDKSAFSDSDLTREDLLHYRKTHPVTLKDMKGKSEIVMNSTLSARMPLLTLAIRPKLVNNPSVIVLAVIRMDRLHAISGRSRVLETFVVSRNGDLVSHANLSLVAKHGKASWIPIDEISADIPVVGTTLRYNHGDVDTIGSLFQVGFGGLVAVAEIPSSAAFLSTRELLNNLMIVALLLLTFFTVFGLFWSRRLTRPIELLSKAANFIGAGKFDVKVEHSSKDEMGDLAESFNVMATELKTRADALEQAQNALVHSEKMSAFGQMSAGIAHEVKNPLAGILGYVQLSQRKLDEDHPIRKNLDIIEKETRRCTDIISNLMRFARQEKAVYEHLDINRVVKDALDIVDHQLGLKGVKIETELADGLPAVEGSANQLQQVLMNFAINSQHAMEKAGGGTFRVTTQAVSDDMIEIRVADTGPGIPPEIQDKIFEPFFTTKRAGEGTGLGLAVSYGIIKEHGGDIILESEQGKGTTFVVSLPAFKDNVAHGEQGADQ